MPAIIFSILLFAILLAWFQRPRAAIFVFTISLILASFNFYQHVTDVIGLSL